MHKDHGLNDLASSCKSRQHIHNSAEMSYASHYGTDPTAQNYAKYHSKSTNCRNKGLKETSSGINLD